ncbi:MAG: hypothetical protein PHD03_03335 [Bacilli bacterium]|nr:hypothetical protein [Bacilli bacterium]MDD4407167.1 hypothetical protein [Bacilli bacterium]
MKKESYFADGLLIIFLLLTLIFKNKFVVIAPNLDVSISIFIYSFTFLILGYILTKYKYKEAKKTINISIILILLFLILNLILNNTPGNAESEINQSLLNIFTPYNISILGQNIYLNDLSIILILLIYYITHNIFISINDTLNTITNKYLSFGISIFIAFIIDTMFMVPTLYIKDIYYANLDAFDIIKYLTANFMVLIIMSLLSLLIYTLIFQKKKNQI